MTKIYKLGYTTGVFDLFHIGHLNILKKAKEQCEYLIVGVSTDENVLSYKKKTPIIPFEERIAIVEALKYVDKVVPQTNMNKFQAWENLKFNAIFHGDDWKCSKMYEEIERKFREVGVEMVYFPYTKGTSSSMLVDVLEQVLIAPKASNE
jgi:glycerol-3-phosphate cytidylyltransferase